MIESFSCILRCNLYKRVECKNPSKVAGIVKTSGIKLVI